VAGNTIAADRPPDGPDPSGGLPTPGKTRVAVHYALLLAALAGVIGVVSVVHHGTAQPKIAGGYTVSKGVACVGPQLQVIQSGQYVDLSNTKSTVGGTLTFKHDTLTGSVSCIGGHHLPIHATVVNGVLSGALGGAPLSAVQSSDPPPAGSPKPYAPASIDGSYSLSPASQCLGGSIVLKEKGSTVKVVSAGKPRGTLQYIGGAVTGTVACERGTTRYKVTGAAVNLSVSLMLASPTPSNPATPNESVVAAKTRTGDQQVVAFFVAIIVVMVLARLIGALMPKIGQPRVMGEVLAGLLLGPSVFGLIDPGLQLKIFAPDIVPYINVTANLGLIFYMFLIGMEVDFTQLRGRFRTTAVVSNTALLLPMMLGLLVAIPLTKTLAPSGVRFGAFALFVAVSMSITAFPVLARIVSERRMLRRPLGVLAVGSAAIDDVTAWFMIALATALTTGGGAGEVLKTIGWTLVYVAGMGIIVRPILARAAIAYEELGRVPAIWITAIFAGVLLSALTTDRIGIAVIFGGFVMGLVMPRRSGLTEEVTNRVQDFVLTILLPLFFAYTGLKTNVTLLNRESLILVTLGLIALAIIGKYGGTLLASRTIQLPWRESAALGALMNTRGLTELIVLNLALSLGVITQALFTALVLMALVTTFMAGPLLRLIDPRNEFGESAEAELEAAPSVAPVGVAPAGGSILLAPQSGPALAQLLELAEPLAHSDPPREVVLAQFVQPPRGIWIRGGLQSEQRRLAEAEREVQVARDTLVAEGIPARAAAITSASSGSDVSKLAARDDVALVLIDGRRPMLGSGIPREGVGEVLRSSPGDVAVLVAREGARVAPGPGAVVAVPFGGARHDWVALEIAAAICSATGASLRLIGSRGDGNRDASTLLENATMLVRNFVGVEAESVLADPGREGILQAVEGAELVFIGLSDRWRQEGLGETRRAIARAAPAPIVFVRAGERTGELEPSADLSRFGWSRA